MSNFLCLSALKLLHMLLLPCWCCYCPYNTKHVESSLPCPQKSIAIGCACLGAYSVWAWTVAGKRFFSFCSLNNMRNVKCSRGCCTQSSVCLSVVYKSLFSYLSQNSEATYSALPPALSPRKYNKKTTHNLLTLQNSPPLALFYCPLYKKMWGVHKLTWENRSYILVRKGR